MIFSKFERMLAWRYLRPKGGEGFVSIIALFSFLGILLGVATLIIVMSVMNGFRAELFDNILKFNGHLHVSSLRPGGLNLEALKADIKNDPNVLHINTILEGQAMVSFSGTQAKGLMVRGISQHDLQQQDLIASNLHSGTLKNLEKSDTIIIGEALALYGNIHVGDTLKLIAPSVNMTAFGSVPRFKDFRVGGIFSSGNYNYDANYVFIPFETAEKIFVKAKPELEIFLNSPHNVDPLLDQIVQLTQWKASIKDWRQSNRAFFDAVMVERNVMFIILTLIVVIAAFNIISGLIMLVKDKTKAIAILRTMGATRGSIMRIFLLTGASIGFTGTFAGLLLGLAFCHNIELIRQSIQTLTGTKLFQGEIYFLSKIPAIVETNEVITIVLVSLSLTLFATLYPSRKAAKLDPVEALRYE